MPDSFEANPSAMRKVRVAVTAVNIDTRTPMTNTSANPLMTAVPPIQKRMMPVRMEERFESRIELHARWNPSFIASFSDFPAFNSSLVRSKMRMFASTAIPIESMNAARPAVVRVTGMSLNIVKERTT